ncbi:hypothetical protein [Streptomyces sp. DSM 40907]|uniref:hypothetical protein n=1 Tax=Streptomyces kutzneri TaxID=3051179 RepID=UPI0028D01684|nr:hypothetical protein [Streptomyces sp. DSM 40907]
MHMRRSLGRTAFPFLVLLVVLNTLLRPMAWRHEPMWAVYQYNFSVMLLGPILAGVAAWEGHRLSRARTFLSAHHRPFTVLSAAWAALLAWSSAAFLLGLSLVLGLVAGAGTPPVLGRPELMTPLPALALLGLACAVGLTAGWLAGDNGKLAAPLMAIAVFLTFLLLYAGDLSEFVMVGGATSSLVGLRPKAGTQTSQAVFYAAATLLALLAGAWSAAPHRLRPRHFLAATATAVLCALSAGHLASADPLYLEARPGDVRCHGTRPEICLGRGYSSYKPHLRARLTPLVQAMAQLDLPAPTAFRQDALSSTTKSGQLSPDTITGDRELLLDMFLGTYYGSDCAIEPGSALERAHVNARYWLAEAVGLPPYEDPVLDPRLTVGAAAERISVARAAFQRLAACDG